MCFFYYIYMYLKFKDMIKFNGLKLFLILLLIPNLLFTPNLQQHVKPIVLVSQLKSNSIKFNKPSIKQLVYAMIDVESGGIDHITGDHHLGKNYAAGALQIRPIMLKEVNRILKLQGKTKKYQLKDRFNRQKSIEMFYIWKKHHHPNNNLEKIARNWNGGPRGYLKESTQYYWTKIESRLDDI